MMDTRATELLAALRSSSTSIESKSATLSKIKSEIKQKNVPEGAISTIFEAFRLAISSPHSSLATAGFSSLGHLLKRLYLQEGHQSVAYHGRQMYPLLLERIGDHKERIRSQASQAFTDFWPAAPAEVEHHVLETGLSGKNSRAKETSMLWLAKMTKEHGLLFRSYVPRLVACLEDADSGVRETAKSTVIQLFQNVPSKALSDLRKQLQLHNVRKSIVASIMSSLGTSSLDPDISISQSHSRSENIRPTSSFSNRRDETHRSGSVLSSRSQSNGDGSNMQPRSEASFQSQPPPKLDQSGGDAVLTHNTTTETVPVTNNEAAEGDAIEPLYVNSQRELDDNFRDMMPHFDGKESEHNWGPREKSVLRMRRITRGNAPYDYQHSYIAGIKTMLDGILKTVHSLRTTVSSAGCNLLQDVAQTCGPGIDHMVEILLQQLIKLCGSLKKITSQNGNATVDIIMGNVSYTTRITQHIWGACQEKNVQPRLYASGWIKTVISTHGKHKAAIEHGGGLELIEKCIKKCLGDPNPGVRENMRGAYWTFARVFPDRADTLMSTLDNKSRNLLEKDPANPNRENEPQKTESPRSKPGQTTPGRSALKETISAQKKARLGGSKKAPSRPESAQSTYSDVKATRPVAHRQPGSTSSAVRTVPTGAGLSSSQSASLSSAPMRPSSRPRRPELARPATADPYSSRKSAHAGPTSKPQSPAAAPRKPRTKSVTVPKSEGATPARPKSRPNDASQKNDGNKTTKPEDPMQFPKQEIENVPDVEQYDPSAATGEVAPPRTPAKQVESSDMPLQYSSVLPGTEIAASEDKGVSQGGDRFGSEPRSRIAAPPSSGPPRRDSVPSPHQLSGTNDATISHIPISPSHSSHKSSGDAPAALGSATGRHSRDPSNEFSSKIPTPTKRSSLTGPPETHPTSETLQVYEDPQSPADSKSSGVPADSPYVSPKTPRTAAPLEELPLNEPASIPNRKHNQMPDTEKSRRSVSPVAPSSENSHRRWKKVEVSERKRSLSPRSKDPARGQDMIERGLNKIRAGAIDVHGYRKFQSLLRYHESVVTNETKYDQILMALLEAIESPDGDKPTGRSLDLKTQVLVTIRLLLVLNGQLFARYYARTVTAIIRARKHYDNTNHIVSGLEETSEDVVGACDPPEVINAVLHLLETEGKVEEGYSMVAMGAYILGGLLQRLNAKNMFLSEPELQRLGEFARQNLRNPQPDVRRAVIEFCLQLHDMVKPEDVFWAMVDTSAGDVRPLLTYYIMRKPTRAQ